MSHRAQHRGFPIPIDHLADVVQALQGLKEPRSEPRSLEEIAESLELDEKSLRRRLNEAATAAHRKPLYAGKPASITDAGEWFLQEALPVVEAYRGQLFPNSAVPFAVVSGGLLCIAGVGILRLLSPGFTHYDARDPAP